MTAELRVSIVGGSGYGGGELLRLLLRHPRVELAQVVSQSQAGQFVHSVHPNLRPTYGETPLRFTSPDALEPCDVLFLAQPHGAAQQRIAHYASLAERIIDLSADFRLHVRRELRADLRASARRAGVVGALRLWPAGSEPRGDS